MGLELMEDISSPMEVLDNGHVLIRANEVTKYTVINLNIFL